MGVETHPWCRHTAHRLVSTLVLVVLLALSATASAVAREQAEEAAGFVQAFVREADGAFTDRRFGSDQSRHRLRQLVAESFNMNAFGHLVLAEHWSAASDDQRGELQGLLADYMLSTLRRHIRPEAGLALEVIGARGKGEKGATVKSLLVAAGDGQRLRIEWRLLRTSERWRIVDLAVQGISLAQAYRSQFLSILENNGGRMTVLLERLRQATTQTAMADPRGGAAH